MEEWLPTGLDPRGSVSEKDRIWQTATQGASATLWATESLWAGFKPMTDGCCRRSDMQDMRAGIRSKSGHKLRNEPITDNNQKKSESIIDEEDQEQPRISDD